MTGTRLPLAKTSARIPSLDGLRALSILLVLALHTLQRVNLQGHLGFGWYALCNGGFGVFIFFEISGFLITTLLLEERRRHGSIDLRQFYLRRAFRILPPLYLYLGVVCLLAWADRLTILRADLVSAIFFFHNYVLTTGTWSLEHLWSISVEEQFYLLWPALLVLALRHKKTVWAVSIPVAVLALSPVLRVVLSVSANQALRRFGLTNVNLDFLMFGCLVALLQGLPRFERVYAALSRVVWIPLVCLLGCSVLGARFGNYFTLTVGYTLESVLIGFLMLWLTRNPESAAGRVLNWRPVAWIGVLSYSIYLWQTLFLHPLDARVFGNLFGAVDSVAGLILRWAAILLVACASYYLVERPALLLRGHTLRGRARTG